MKIRDLHYITLNSSMHYARCIGHTDITLKMSPAQVLSVYFLLRGLHHIYVTDFFTVEDIFPKYRHLHSCFKLCNMFSVLNNISEIILF